MRQIKISSIIDSPSFYSILAQVFRIISGPLILLVLSKKMSPDELGFYFTFINIAAMQQMMEMGFGFTTTQFVAHAISSEKTKSERSKSINNYHRLTKVWFFSVALLILTVINGFGLWFYSDYVGVITWIYPWFILIIGISVSSVFMPMQILLEGGQKQKVVYKVRLISSLIYTLVLFFLIVSNCGLYSLGLATLISSIAVPIMLYREFSVFNKNYKCIEPWNLVDMKLTFKEVWPMLSKISISWVFGYFFWNSFNLITFKIFNAEVAGKMGMSISLLKAGYSISESLMVAKVSRIANLISQKKIRFASVVFYKTYRSSLLLLMCGYSIFYLLLISIDIPFLNKKILDPVNLLGVALYFVLLLPITLQASYCRAFKCEPYFYLSLFMNISLPFAFYLSCLIIPDGVFFPLCVINFICLLWSYKIYNGYRLKIKITDSSTGFVCSRGRYD